MYRHLKCKVIVNRVLSQAFHEQAASNYVFAQFNGIVELVGCQQSQISVHIYSAAKIVQVAHNVRVAPETLFNYILALFPVSI